MFDEFEDIELELDLETLLVSEWEREAEDAETVFRFASLLSDEDEDWG